MKELLIGILVVLIGVGLLYSLGQLNRRITNITNFFTYTLSEDFSDTLIRGATTVVIVFIVGIIVGCLYSLGNWILETWII